MLSGGKARERGRESGEQRTCVVVKVGSSTISAADDSIDLAYLDDLSAQISALKERGIDVVVVSSGAIACGLEVLGIERRPKDMPSLQAAASVGQSALVSAYDNALGKYGLTPSLVLLTRRDTADRNAYLHARDTLTRLLELGVIPIVNENDTVSVEQIRFGDNDTLAALVACLADADKLVILSDIDGLYDADPRKCSRAKLISRVSKIDEGIIGAAGGAGSAAGSGGMETKVKAARVMMAAGIPMVIANGKAPNAVLDAALGKDVGTLFEADSKPHDINPRKLWIALGDSARGSIQVDAGAKAALLEKGSSLLCVGIEEIYGSFNEGDIVDIQDGSRIAFARGRVSASSDELSLACGMTSAELEGNSILRGLAQKPIVHRDELVLFE